MATGPAQPGGGPGADASKYGVGWYVRGAVFIAVIDGAIVAVVLLTLQVPLTVALVVFG